MVNRRFLPRKVSARVLTLASVSLVDGRFGQPLRLLGHLVVARRNDDGGHAHLASATAMNNLVVRSDW